LNETAQRCRFLTFDDDPTAAVDSSKPCVFRPRNARMHRRMSTWFCRGHAMAADGLKSVKSNHGPAETMRRLEAAVRAKGLTVFAHVDHAAGAAAVGLALRPTDLLVFGNARGGTPLMQANQTIGLDLPLKALVWQDEAGTTWVSYNDPAWLAQRHGLGNEVSGPLSAMTALLEALATEAAAPA
jgi:uncharacterized protein (DUF302 family)